jgi:lactoylglutathione lyase
MEAKYLGLRTVGYKVTDISAAKEWYSKVLGIEPYFDQPFYVGYNVGGYELGLQPEEAGDTAKTNNTVTYWGVDNVHEIYNELLDEGATPHGEPMDVGEGIIVASVKDPWGNAFGIIYNPLFTLD